MKTTRFDVCVSEAHLGEGAWVGIYDPENPVLCWACIYVQIDRVEGGTGGEEPAVYAWAGLLSAESGAPRFAAAAAIAHACAWLRVRGVPGVIIHAEGWNARRAARGLYKRLGFAPVPGIPGLFSASLADVERVARRWLAG